MPKKHKLFQDGDYDDIPTPVSLKCPIEKPNPAATKKVSREDKEKNRKQKSDNESSKIQTDNDDSEQVVKDDRVRKKKKRKKLDSDSISSRKDSDSDSGDKYYPPSSFFSASKILSKKMPYSSEEDKMIVRYVTKFNRIKETTSNNLWKRLERTEGIEGNFRKRTWQSLKNRFLRNIVPHLLTKFKSLLDERNVNMVLGKFPHLRSSLRKSQIEALLKEKRNSEKMKSLNVDRESKKSSEDDENSEGILKLHKIPTSTPLKDIKNKCDTRLRRENNDVTAKEFFSDNKSKSKSSSVRRRKKDAKNIEVIRIEETSEEEEESLIVDKTPEDLLQDFIDEQNEEIMETQLEGEPCGFSDLPKLTDSENSVPVHANSEALIAKSHGPSQSLLFRDGDKGILECEKDLDAEEGKVNKPVRLRKKMLYKPLHRHSKIERLEFNQLLRTIIRAKKRKYKPKIKRPKNEVIVKKRKMEVGNGCSEERKEKEIKGRKSNEKINGRKIDDEIKGKTNEGENESDDSFKNKEDEEDQTKRKESVRSKEREDGVGKMTEKGPAEEVQILKVQSCNMLEYFTTKALHHYKTLMSDDSDCDTYEKIEKFTKKMTNYSKSLTFKREINSSDDEDVSPPCYNYQGNKSKSNSNYSQLDAHEKSDTSIEKLNLNNLSSTGLLGRMYGMLSEKEKMQV